jgi:hypothetical protein
LEGYTVDAQAGVAGWRDNNDCSRIAQQALTETAGIAIPKADFILTILGVYLFILVPANWAIFRALQHVEWAWAAVPLLAVLGMVVVVRLAQLDIGFARSRTEVAVVELQPGYARAHVTRFTGIYSALSTTYDFLFDDGTALVLPMGRQTTPVSFDRRVADTFLRRADQREDRIRLESFLVNSNTTGMIHSEPMVDAGGLLSFVGTSGGRGELRNQTRWELNDAAVVRMNSQGRFEAAWVGNLRAGDSTRIEFRNVREPGELGKVWRSFGEVDSGDQRRLDLRPLLTLAINPRRFRAGDIPGSLADCRPSRLQ